MESAGMEIEIRIVATKDFMSVQGFFASVGLLLLLGGGMKGQDAPQHSVAPNKELAKCEQLILVVTPSWNVTSGLIQVFERKPGRKWIPVRPSFPCVVGKNGLGWGMGIHGAALPGVPRKREGDGRAPAGIFRLNACLGFASPKEAGIIRFPYRQITATTEAVYDPKSRYYNREVDRNAVAQVDWSRAEPMLSNGLYRWAIIVEHNWKQSPGFGSCIFLHLWSGQGKPTIGCTAMGLDNLKFLVHWLDANKYPLLVQLPEPTYRSLKQQWTLP